MSFNAASTATLPYPYTLADLLFSKRGSRSFVADALLVVGASMLVALSARVAIPLPFTPVPVTGQTFAVLLAGMLLGSRRGALALILYLIEGAVGLPVWAPHGLPGLLRLAGPTAGYLWSYPFAAALVGTLAEKRWERRPQGAAFAMALGSAFILLIGSLWLGHFLGSMSSGFTKGALPFLPGEGLKVAVAAALLPGGWALVRRVRGE